MHAPSSAYDKNLYGILCVDPKAPKDVIDAAHRALLKLCAPRAIGDTQTRAKEIGEAYMILSSETDRRKYDDYRRTKVPTIGPYRKIAKIASGGFGTTYKAEHALLGELSCIKECSEISAEANEILKEETRAIWNLRHYGLPVMRDLIELKDGSYALVSSWVEGPTLQQLIEKVGKLDPEHVAWISERLLNTISYLHDHGVLHGDIKPQNIIIQPETHIVVLIDYGLSVIKPTASSPNKGYTELFSPPEQEMGKSLVPGSDFYSLGMTMLYAFGGGYDVLKQKRIPASVPDPLSEFVRSLIVRNVLERPRDARKLFEHFLEVRLASFGRAASNMKPLPVS